MVRSCIGTVAAVAALLVAAVACKGRGEEPTARRSHATPAVAGPAAASTVSAAAAAPSSVEASPRPRYLRADPQGAMVDAFRFPSVPASMVEREVARASTKRDVAAILRRFGVNPTVDRAGEVSLQPGSLVDRLGRERLLIAAFRGEPDDHGALAEDDWLVFLGTTEDDRLIGLGSASVSGHPRADAPIAIELRTLHSADVDDVVATWSSCASEADVGCHGMRAWTMERGFPERIVDVLGDGAVTIGDDAAPHAVTTGARVLRFDPATFVYR